LDRWRAINDTDGSYTVSQSSDVPSAQGFTNSLLVTVNTADSVLGSTQRASIQQRIEGYRVADFAYGTASPKAAILSFWVKSSVTGLHGISIRNGASGATRSYNFRYQVLAANTWELQIIEIPGDLTGTWNTTSGIGMNITWSLGAGASALGADFWTSGATDGSSSITAFPVQTSGATWQITGVQLEASRDAGSSARTPFERRPMALEMLLCQRYYWKSYNHEIAPGTATSVGQYASVANANGNWRITVPFKATMRDTPTTVTSYSPATGSAGAYRDDGSSAPFAADRTATLVSAGADNASFSGLATQYSGTRFHVTAEAEL
jgi:hypothetical protein